jgi:hypothetical protein
LEVSLTNDSSSVAGNAATFGQSAGENSFTLRDLYERASISGNSLSAELDCYLNVDENTASLFPKESSQQNTSVDDSSIHEMALTAILAAVVSNSAPPLAFVRAPEPPGGVQEWWSRMLSGSMNSPQPTVTEQR